jgi:hypothetical protein
MLGSLYIEFFFNIAELSSTTNVKNLLQGIDIIK